MRKLICMVIHLNHSFLSWLNSLIFFSANAAPQRGLWRPHSRGFTWSHTTDKTQSVGLFWTSDQLVTETSTWQHTTLTTDRYPCRQWDPNPRSQQASGRRPTSLTARPLGPAINSLIYRMTPKKRELEKPNKNWRNPRKKIYWQKLYHYNFPFKRQ